MPDLVAIGHILMDIRVQIDKQPRPDEEARIRTLSFGGGGSAANVAVGASRLGLKSGFIGSVGFDTFGRVLLEELERDGVDISNVKVDIASGSGMTFIAVDRRGLATMYGYPGASDSLEKRDLDREYIRSARHIHITGLPIETATWASRIASKGCGDVSFDPGRLMSALGLKRLGPVLKNVNEVLMNTEEARKITGHTEPEKIFKALHKTGPTTVILKMGAEGVTASDNKTSLHVPAYPVKVIDTTGAGDAFSAGFITARLEGKDLMDCVRFANAVASIKITKAGARAMPFRSEVELFLKSKQRQTSGDQARSL
ncbi:carbohydrate kinase family protein [Candidatus Bathyarchaeota archaeon]|nr:carbohydrate kinase family protein [Candidatus Bathyarchaeota archaeon]